MIEVGDAVSYNGKEALVKELNIELNLAQLEVDTGIIVYRPISSLEKGEDMKEKESEKSALDVQVGSNHYKNLAIQPIEYITKNNLSFSQGNVIKYITRYKNKNGLEDLKKAKHMIDLMIQLEYNDN